MISPQVAKEVGSRLGEIEEVEWRKRKDDINFFYKSKSGLTNSEAPEKRWVYCWFKRRASLGVI